MNGISFEVDASEIKIVADKLDDLSGFQRHELLDMMGGMVAEQTKERIASEKTTPSGAPWLPNQRGGDILVLEGHLLGSIDHQVSSDQTEVGSAMVYAAIHNNGGMAGPGNKVEIPSRQYLGLSVGNIAELETELGNWLEGKLQ